jgi:hypothetical protein
MMRSGGPEYRESAESSRSEREAVADSYTEIVLRAVSTESGIAGNHDSEDIPEVEITEEGSDKPKPEARARRFRIFHGFLHATNTAA